MHSENIAGTGASAGIAIGKAFLIPEAELNAVEKKTTSPEQEEKKFNEAIENAKQKINETMQRALGTVGHEHAQVFEAHLMMLDDPEFTKMTIDCIHAKKTSARNALAETSSHYVALFEAMSDPYLRERAADVREVSNLVLQNLDGQSGADLDQLKEPVIVIAKELSASQTAMMDRSKVLGFITEIGGKNSHTAIMARTLEIPAVLGVSGILNRIKDGQAIALNGETGEILFQPSHEQLTTYNQLKEALEQERQNLKTLVGRDTVTRDGRRIKLEANISALQDLPIVKKYDAEGVGLFRTEFLYMSRVSEPSEDEQFEFYKSVLSALSPQNVVIRTLDVGGDKEIPYLNIEAETNPFMGLRALRYCLQNQALFTRQLRALLRASVYGKLSIMFPFVTTLDELLAAKEILNQVKTELRESKVAFDEDINVGIMIEIPSAAIISDVLAQHVDFFSIGTNDLIQYSCAVDRTNKAVNHLYDAHNPAVLRLIQMVIKNAEKYDIPVAVCGEMASDPELIPVLLGMGLREFSMNPSYILRSRKLVLDLSYQEQKTKLTDFF
jgi:phosphoenolpyruvate-protein phosphotransferase (PTS system enzyme I)